MTVRILALAGVLWLAGAPVGAAALTISGAGASFPYPVYAKWAEAYKAKSGVGLNYQSIGSGAGIRQIKAATVSFGATDKPLGAKELDASRLVQFPMVIGGVVPVINIPGVQPGEIALDGTTLADIYLGRIESWDDERIRALNPAVKLPRLAIAPIYRADGSGTNFLFTAYLAGANPRFKSEVGVNTVVEWPVGIGAKGNEGVANMTRLTTGAIGYVEYSFVRQIRMTYLRLRNRAGRIVAPGPAAFQAAAAHADWESAPGYEMSLLDQPGADSWPLTGASFILMRREPKDPRVAAETLRFFAWALANGDAIAEGLGYVSLPDNLVRLVERTWAESIRSDGVAIRPLEMR